MISINTDPLQEYPDEPNRTCALLRQAAYLLNIEVDAFPNWDFSDGTANREEHLATLIRKKIKELQNSNP